MVQDRGEETFPWSRIGVAARQKPSNRNIEMSTRLIINSHSHALGNIVEGGRRLEVGWWVRAWRYWGFLSWNVTELKGQFRHLIITIMIISCMTSSLYFPKCFHLTEPFGSILL